MSEKERIKQELDEISPLLSKLKGKSDAPFRVPDNYFQSLQDDVLRQIALEKVEHKVVEPRTNWLDRLIEQWQWILQPRYAMSLATVAILLVVAGIFFLRPVSPSSQEIALTELSEEDITNYISSNIEDFEVGLLVEAIDHELDPDFLPTLELEETEFDNYLEDIIDDIDLEELEDLL